MKYNTGGRGNTPIINDRNMGKIGTMSQSNLVTTHGIFNSNIDITCGKCNREIVVLVDEERVMVLENRRGSEKDGRAGQVRVSVQKSKEPGKMKPMKRAANY